MASKFEVYKDPDVWGLIMPPPGSMFFTVGHQIKKLCNLPNAVIK
ncbi:MAG: hypothetical protein U5P10_13040 [Spirochaetia bacterium]|nr:hypothetical protein [Spirochaetia bacterium]